MKVAYSIAGEGYGHAARMACLVPVLEPLLDLRLFCPSSVRTYLTQRLEKRNFHEIPWFGFVKKGARILYLATFFKALKDLPHFLHTVTSLSKLLKKEGFEAVISDFEPYLAWAAWLARIPVIQLNHPGIIVKQFPTDPRGWVSALAALFIQGPWNHRIICSFYNGDVGPLIRKELLVKKVQDSGKWVLHLKPEYHSLVIPLLESEGMTPYEIYPKKNGDFDSALACARGVISSAGHQIISEALVLGKPILVIPQQGQYEQSLNARELKKIGLGMEAAPKNLKNRLRQFKFWALGLNREAQFQDDTEKLLQLVIKYLKIAPPEAQTEKFKVPIAL